jgi:symplekin
MNGMTREFAHQMLRKLQKQPESKKSTDEEGDAAMEEGEMPPEALIQTPYLPDRIELPARSDQVLQHLELMFALSTKVPDFLDE